ncbi:unnamed protein product [Urochloa humidicola]
MAISSRPMLSLFLLILATSSNTTTVLASDDGTNDDGLTHIHLYAHETFKGTNATAITVVASPFGANSSFGSVSVLDDELRVGRDRSSELVGRYQGFFVGTGLEGGTTNFMSSITYVFTSGEYEGSTLSMQGAVLGFNDTIERPLVGGTGKFRMARGYSLVKLLDYPTPETGLLEVDLFVLMSGRKY